MNNFDNKRFVEYKEKCEVKGIRSLTSFLSLEEQQLLINICGSKVVLIKNGGFIDAERVRYIIKPLEDDYIEDDFEVEVLKADYDKNYYMLEHKDVLGALIGLGINRNQIGDIYITDNNIYIAATNNVASLIIDSLNQIKRCKLSFNITDDIIENQISFIEKKYIIASLRLDVLVKNLANTSREKAQQYIKDGNVKIANEECTNPNKIVGINERITIRGYGKFFIKEILGNTKKENIIALIAKYQ